MASIVVPTYSGVFSLPIPIDRLNPLPADSTYVWATKALAEDYAANGATSYVGQLIYVQDENKVYKINNTEGALSSVGELPIASSSVLGGVKIGANLTIDPTTGVLSANASQYNLPIASLAALGGIKSSTTGTVGGRNYYVEVDQTNGVAWVNVPWTDTVFTPVAAGKSQQGEVTIGDNIDVTETGTISVPQFSTTKAGVAPISDGSNSKYLRADGVWSVIANLPAATSSAIGGILSQTTGTTANRDYVIQVANDGKAKVNVPWIEYSVFSASVNGLVPKASATGDNARFLRGDGTWAAPTFTIPIADATTVGGIKSQTTGTTPNRDYVIQVDSEGLAKVNVPWINYELPAATASTRGGFKVGSGLLMSGDVLSVSLPIATQNQLGVVKQGSNILIAGDGTISGNYSVFGANAGLVPAKPSDIANKFLGADGTWKGVTADSVAPATSSKVGGILSQTTGTTANRDYVVEVASDGKAKVNVPWVALTPATDSRLGGIIVGDNLTIDANGVLSAEATSYILPIASASTLGGVKIGSNLTIDSSTGVLSAVNTTYSVFELGVNGLVPKTTDESQSAYFLRGDATWQQVLTSLPIATSSVLGGVKQGANIGIAADGTISAIDTTYNVFSTSTNGLVPLSGENTDKFLRGDGTWASPETAAAAAYAADALDAAMAYVNETVGTIDRFTMGSDGLVPAPTTQAELSLFLRGDGAWSTVVASVPIATQEILGGFKVGTNLDISADGTLNGYVLPTASASTLGGVKIGSGLTMTNGVVSLNMPTATALTLGGIKVGTTLTMDANGVLNAPLFGGSTAGLVPAATSEQAGYFLTGAGTWASGSVSPATSGLLGGIKVGRGTTMNSENQLDLNIASDAVLGGIKVGNGLTIAADGTLSANLPYATSATAGLVKIGENLFIDNNGILSSTDTIYDVFTSQLDGLVPKALNVLSPAQKFLNAEGNWVSITDTTSAAYASEALDAAMQFAIGLNGNVFSSIDDGLVPAADGEEDSIKFLRGDGTWAMPTVGSVSPATTTVVGGILSQTTGTTTGRDYVIEVDPLTGSAKVNVPWIDYQLPIASASSLGGIKVGTNLTIDADGVLSAVNISTHPATSSTLGGILSQTTGTATGRDYLVEVDQYGYAKVNVPWTDTVYTLPVATDLQLGGIILGDHLTSNGGVVSVVADIYDVFTAAADGLVPAPTGLDSSYFLRADGTWALPAGAASAAYASDALDAAMEFAILTMQDFEYEPFDQFTDGLVPAPHDSDKVNKFLKGDGTWDLPTVGTVAIADTTTVGGIKSTSAGAGTQLPVEVDPETGIAHVAATPATIGAAAANHTHTAAQTSGFNYTTTAPTADNTDGLKVVVLSSAPATRYNGWLYIITE